CSGGNTSQIVNTDPSAKPEYSIPIITPASHPPPSATYQGFAATKRLLKCFPSRKSNESQCPMLASKANIRFQLAKERKASTTLGIIMTTSPNTNNLQQTTKKLRFQLAKERKASTTLGIIMSAFTVCWLPFFVLALIRPFLSSPELIPHSISSFFLWLGYANSLLNPVIYATLNRDFRKPFQQILYFKCSSLNHMMREEFYHSQYGDPTHEIRSDHEFDPSDMEHNMCD
ncbi:5-hydroxytryptamine receptor 7-like, partial [Diaphorina citri]|uniref:5-hydroxytryptamine receptor 7-like n=1 Tax=Diaphorina citri TaxID=121845 RepID=A0A1S3DK91_DIACI